MKSTAYWKWFPRRIRPQNGHGNSVASPCYKFVFLFHRREATEGLPYKLAKLASLSLRNRKSASDDLQQSPQTGAHVLT
jgi:hypothetical protein